MSVRVRLMLLAVIAVVPLLIERVHNEELDRDERIETAYKQALVVARQAAAAQNEIFVSAQTLLQAIASSRTTFDISDGQCNQFVTKIAKPLHWIKTLSVANVRGEIVCSSLPAALGLDISERPHFIAALNRSELFVSDYYVGPRLKVPSVTAALAARNADGTAVAVTLATFDLNWFEHVATTFVPPGGVMLMIDGGGTVLAQYPVRGDLVGRDFKDHPLVRAMLAKPDGFFTDTGLDGVRRIFGFVQLPSTNARIAVGLDEAEVLARANREMWQAFAEAAAVALLALLAIWFGGERLLVRPIRALASTAGRIGRGEVQTHATDLPWSSEFVPLAVALDDMAGQLSAREQELRDSNSQLRELAQLDGLTGLANRRAFNDRMTVEWLHARKQRKPVAVLMIDVDFFKKFNDHYGHVQGDACLRKVGRVLLDGVRGQTELLAPAREVELPPSSHRITGRARRADFAARYGGEEFAVLLRDADLDIALQVGERLRAAVENLLMAHAGAPWGFVSISIGAASMVVTEANDPQALTEAADAALYEAKRQGRNRVTAAASTELSQAV